MRISPIIQRGLFLLCCGCCCAQVPKGVVDFDRSVGFSEPRNVVVYPAVDGNDLVFLIPNGLQVARRSDGTPRMGLTHTGVGRGGNLVVELTPTIDGVPVQEIVSDLKTQYPTLHFAVPGPKSSRFEIGGPGVPTGSVPVRSTGDPMAGNFVYSVRLEPLAVRVLLIPHSYRMAVFAISVEYDVRGVSRNAQGTPAFEGRPFRMSIAMEGFCALSPYSVLNASTGANGCVHPKYPRDLVRQIQLHLREKGASPGAIDGRFGSSTERAIRKVQADNRLPVDGTPTPEFLEFLLPAPSVTSKK
jgi:hypothetical protein